MNCSYYSKYVPVLNVPPQNKKPIIAGTKNKLSNTKKCSSIFNSKFEIVSPFSFPKVPAAPSWKTNEERHY